MGRELRRVPLDFNWPLNKVWEGYINPHFKECPEEAKNRCLGGASPAGKWLMAVCHLLALMGEDAAESGPEYQEHFRKTGRIYPHPFLEEWVMAPRTEVPREVVLKIRELGPLRARTLALQKYELEHPSKLLPLDEELVTLVKGLAKDGDFRRGGCASDIYFTLLEAAGVSDSGWGVCKVCGGEGLDPACKEAYEAWARVDPPSGVGYQLWETTSSGSPISPVFPSEEEFIRYLISEGYSEPAARRFCDVGWAPSMLKKDGITFKDIETLGVVRDPP